MPSLDCHHCVSISEIQNETKFHGFAVKSKILLINCIKILTAANNNSHNLAPYSVPEIAKDDINKRQINVT